MPTLRPCDDVIIGGGFFGCFIAAFLAERGRNVILLEQETELLTRASYANQARVHNGYHYPRNVLTAVRSHENFPRFVSEFSDCVDRSFQKIYAIAHQHSKVNAAQFKRMCSVIGAPIRPAAPAIRRLFNPQLIEEVFVVEECAFDAVRLRHRMGERLRERSVTVLLGMQVVGLDRDARGRLLVEAANGESFAGERVFNCTYAGINSVLEKAGAAPVPLKKEMTEIALVEMPAELRDLGITVMDGPFFSTMPFPPLGLHSLTHVRYTPQASWQEPGAEAAAAEARAQSARGTRHLFMIKDAARYLPAIARAAYKRSLFEIKALLPRNEGDDGRPILLHEDAALPGLYTVLGAKLDNVYDVISALETKTAASGASRV
jgi:glycine/D-amino acid oxidase-like deaminating enzyme